MSNNTSNLQLPYLMAAQAQKHITHNEALRLLDGLVQLSVKSRELTSPPTNPTDGDRYIVPPGAAGNWAGWEMNVALWVDGSWLRLPPQEGWQAWVEDEAMLLVRSAAQWKPVIPSAFSNLTGLGIGMSADVDAPFSARINRALWTARYVSEGGDGSLTQILNREADTDNAGLLLQTDFSTRALIGMYGSEHLRITVSSDGSKFRDAIKVEPATGIADQPNLPRFKAYTNFDNYIATDSWAKIGVNVTDYNDQSCFDPDLNHFIAPVAGTYLFGASALYKINSSTDARMRARLVINTSDGLRGSLTEASGPHASEITTLNLNSMAALNAGDTVALQGNFRVADGYFAAEHTSFWGAKIG